MDQKGSERKDYETDTREETPRYSLVSLFEVFQCSDLTPLGDNVALKEGTVRLEVFGLDCLDFGDVPLRKLFFGPLLECRLSFCFFELSLFECARVFILCCLLKVLFKPKEVLVPLSQCIVTRRSVEGVQFEDGLHTVLKARVFLGLNVKNLMLGRG